MEEEVTRKPNPSSSRARRGPKGAPSGRGPSGKKNNQKSPSKQSRNTPKNAVPSQLSFFIKQAVKMPDGKVTFLTSEPGVNSSDDVMRDRDYLVKHEPVALIEFYEKFMTYD